jgi:L,D-transpeptidase-like protein
LIASKQLAAALARLDPRDWEILDLSLRRRVPDEALAEVLGVDVQEVARRRAAAIERLADDMEIKRGEDLGATLKALLEPEAWQEAEERPEPPTPPPVEATAGNGAAALDGVAPPQPAPRRRSRWLVGAVAGAVLLVAAAAAVTAYFVNRSGHKSSDQTSGTRFFSPKGGGPLLAPFPTDPNVAFRYLTAYVPSSVALYESPGGRRMIRIPGRSEWGSPRVLGVVRQSGGWLGVQVPELPNGELGWIPQRAARLGNDEWSLHADLSKRLVVVRRNGHDVRRYTVAVGARRHSTPTGRFSVTDRLKVRDVGSSPYGCCVLALSGHQTHLPPDWPGGDRLAIHATKDLSSIGKPVSLGCMRLRPEHARWLIDHVPLGTPVFINS